MSGTQFTEWSKNYALHVITLEHSVYSTVFFIAMGICLIAIIPAIFLWGHQKPVEEPEESLHEALTAPIGQNTKARATLATGGSEDPTQPPDNRRRWWHHKRTVLFVSVGLVVLLISSGVLAAFFFSKENGQCDVPPTITSTTSPDSTPISGPRRVQLALDKDALTSVFASQLSLQDDTISDLSVTPQAENGLLLKLTLHINVAGVKRSMPIEIASKVSLDEQQNLQLTITQLKRDDQVVDDATATEMQNALNTMLASTVMPALREQFTDIKLLSVETSSTIGCAQGEYMLVLLIEAPAIEGVEAQPTPTPFCLKGAIDLNNLLPS